MAKKEVKFSIEEAIRFAWEKTNKYFWFFVSIIVILILANAIDSKVASLHDKNKTDVSLSIIYAITYILFLIFSLIMSLGIVKVCLQIVKGEEPKYKNILTNAKYIINYFFIRNIIFFYNSWRIDFAYCSWNYLVY